ARQVQFPNYEKWLKNFYLFLWTSRITIDSLGQIRASGAPNHERVTRFMTMADAQRGRAAGGWTRLRFPGMAAWEDEATGQAKIFAGPAARRLTRAEPVLKRSIPILI